jgi:hypothetical protein
MPAVRMRQRCSESARGGGNSFGNEENEARIEGRRRGSLERQRWEHKAAECKAGSASPPKVNAGTQGWGMRRWEWNCGGAVWEGRGPAI